MICKRVKSNSCIYFVKFMIFTLAIHKLEVKANFPLIYPPTNPTRIQIVFGLGVPIVDLAFEATTAGYVLKAQYYLPDRVERLRMRTRLKLNPGRKLVKTSKFEELLSLGEGISLAATEYLRNSKHVKSNYRWAVYKGLEEFANRMGLSGRECILKSICEEAENPFHFYNGLFGEFLHILLTPSSSADDLSTHSDNEYFHAEHMGRSGAKCGRVFKGCSRSLLQNFSDFHYLSKAIKDILN